MQVEARVGLLVASLAMNVAAVVPPFSWSGNSKTKPRGGGGFRETREMEESSLQFSFFFFFGLL